MRKTLYTVWIKSFINLIFPKHCVVCGAPLVDGEEYLCLKCFLDLPKMNCVSYSNNRAAERFMGKVPVERALGYLHYKKQEMAAKIVAEIKYKNNRKLGEWMGALMASDIAPSGFFDGIDLLVPVPLHWTKKHKRGFNQSTAIARGIQSVTAIPIEEKNISRRKANATQTKKKWFDRWLNTVNLFKIVDAESFKGKHILIIDDVLTSGSTMEAVAKTTVNVEGVKISILALSMV
ncbi:MAG: double zinc ribbon domain-containing protein [Dysgonamonadaceae bacterium]|nr:double zinc ribbon domain-containing protein [Dysgonamonadaceae bacterium]